jgi:hypothetical protein
MPATHHLISVSILFILLFFQQLWSNIAQSGEPNDCPANRKPMARSLSDLKEIGCKFTWPVHISPLF